MRLSTPVPMPSQNKVFQNCGIFEELDILKGSGNARCGNRMGFDIGYIQIFQQEHPLIEIVKPVDAVEYGGLARAVGSDNGKYLSLADFEADPIQGL